MTARTPRKPPTDDEVDRQVKNSFPASDPPSYSGGDHFIGAPEGRKSKSPGGGSPEVKDAEAALHRRPRK